MSSAGYLYILVNQSMPGLIKVGRTGRDPSNRVQELSSPTGVPTRFILVYQTQVADCEFAERWVHEQLEAKGHRVAQNREFFEAPVQDAIDLLLEARKFVGLEEAIEVHGLEHESEMADDGQATFELGLAYLDGSNDILRNPEKALTLFEQAAVQGNALACITAGQMYMDPESRFRDIEKAQKYFMRAINEHGMRDQFCNIASLFVANGQREAAETAWRQFFQAALESNANMKSYGGWAWNYCLDVCNGRIGEVISRADLRVLREGILRIQEEMERQNPKMLPFRSKVEGLLCE